MSNPFLYNVLTTNGANLVAQATAANPLVFVSSLTCTSAAESDTDLATKGKDWYTGRTGSISAVSATKNVAKIVATYDNSGSEQIVKSVCVTAKLSNQNDSDAVVLCAKSDPDSTVKIPGADQLHQIVEFPFNIVIDSSSTVSVTPGASASVADLSRFVSLYKAGDPSEGETQRIKGEKVFEGTISTRNILANSAFTAENRNILIAAGKSNPAAIQVGWNSTLSEDAVYIGGMQGGWRIINRVMLPDAQDTGVIGNDSYPVHRIVATTLEATNIGTTTHKVSNVYAENLLGCIPQPSYNSSASKPVTIPVGGIALVFVYYDWQHILHTGETFQIGPTSSHYTLIQEAKWVDDSTSRFVPGSDIETSTTVDSTTTYYTWRLLSALDSQSGSSQSGYGVCLVMRTA